MNDVYFEELDHGITMIDAQLYRQGQVSTYLIVEGGRAAFVETGTAHSVPGLLTVLDASLLQDDAHIHVQSGIGLDPRKGGIVTYGPAPALATP